MKPRVLVALGSFWPGNDASGPNQSFVALASALQSEFEFRVIARDRAPGASARTAPEGWLDLGFAQARYLEARRFGARGLTRLLRETPHDVLWLNSVYDREFTLPILVARALGATKARVILSPRGEFGQGALAVKAGKKRLFLPLARAALWRDLIWHATSEAEARDIAAEAPSGAEIVVAPNLRLMLEAPAFTPPGEALRLAFVGRIVPIKGLDFALRALAQLDIPATFEIFGPPEDAATYAQCRALAERLPAHVRAIWRGATGNDEIVRAMGRTDLFFLPTGGENFGHAIFEALACGTPVLISDRTPWRGLEARQAGFDLPLERPDAFVTAMRRFAALPQAQRAPWREGARACARDYLAGNGLVEASAALIRRALP